MPDYDEAIQWLYSQCPPFQNVGAGAYKPGLARAYMLDNIYGCPSDAFPSIHIAGTNGKGSSAHMLAAILQSAGYKVGLYTSPHLVDFRERIRVNGQMIPRQDVLAFINDWRQRPEADVIEPSFFELTMTMAFHYFAQQKVDVAIVEVGLGGRLDSTNILTPALSLITNISLDHTQYLGDTLESIAREKGGIIKHDVPVVVSEAEGSIRRIFQIKASEVKAPIFFAPDHKMMSTWEKRGDKMWYHDTPFGTLQCDLTGKYQPRNMAGVLQCVLVLQQRGWAIEQTAVAEGLNNVMGLTGLQGRWMKVADSPLTIIDTGHNVGGWQQLAPQIADLPGHHHIVVGFAADKDISHILDLLASIPRATFYFTQPSVKRGLPSRDLRKAASKRHIDGRDFPTVKKAVEAARKAAAPDDTIFIGGSNFVVADFLS
ncbi:MAG: bifunctional folylpolyglutamate synthase/dihydrofolate synthase [Bacteroidales bacterium]|nr:bifunctional folylpolyglutamate synthase/dihydrofolate synthase [Bacteroidales bacterium]